LIGRLFTTAKQLAAQEGIAESGYRLVVNTNADAGQSVFHIHLHLLGGAPMKHSMG
jgi:histidine triad (HIT) family protein